MSIEIVRKNFFRSNYAMGPSLGLNYINIYHLWCDPNSTSVPDVSWISVVFVNCGSARNLYNICIVSVTWNLGNLGENWSFLFLYYVPSIIAMLITMSKITIPTALGRHQFATIASWECHRSANTTVRIRCYKLFRIVIAFLVTVIFI